MATLILVMLGTALASDPTCAHGIANDESHPSICCAASCGRCGGPSCGMLPGGSAACCEGTISASNRSCAVFDAPCKVPQPGSPPTECGEYPAPLASDRPNVMLIGDSISMPVPYTPGGYGAVVRAMLTNRSMNVWHQGGWGRGGQASNTVKGLMCTNASVEGNWLNFSGERGVHLGTHLQAWQWKHKRQGFARSTTPCYCCT